METITIFIKHSDIKNNNIDVIHTVGIVTYYVLTHFKEFPETISLYDAIYNIDVNGEILSDNLFKAIVLEYKNNIIDNKTYDYFYSHTSINTLLSNSICYNSFLVMDISKTNAIYIHNLNIIVLPTKEEDTIIISYKTKIGTRKSRKVKIIDDIDERNKQEETNKLNNKRNRRKNSKKKE